MPRLLIISYVFPPAGGITVQRALSFAKYLPALGFEVHVLTAANAASPVYDPGLLKHIPEGVSIHRSFTPELPFYFRKKLWDCFAGPSQNGKPKIEKRPAHPGLKGRTIDSIRRFLSPDPQVVWVPFAVRSAARIIRREQIDYVLTTAPPFSVFLAGNALKRRFPQIKLISDFRDEWLRFYVSEFEFLRSDETRRRAEAMERATIEQSDLVLAVTSSSLEEIAGRHRDQPARKFALVSNGYDPEVFRAFTPRPHPPGKLVITHLGTAYKSSSPRYFLDALDGLPQEIRNGVELRFIGRVAETETELFESRPDTVKPLGFMPQEEALRHVEETDFLLLTMTNDYSLPGKLFEYMAMGKPVLAISPRGGEVDRILAETGAGWCAPPDDAAAIQRLILRAWAMAGSSEAFSPDGKAIRRYERPRLAAQLATLIEDRLGPSAP